MWLRGAILQLGTRVIVDVASLRV
uniref:Uncharacterized protein n=1 Tax=Anguilla anguilla TaxID=7936 RepID=A0A0E9UVC5_ANGAN